ncbi:immunity protein Tsi6 family protein [Dyadobacter psychrophilus]|uniref:Tsi6 domain-containing protein n=1 Tax=Dyadobacter psychrophilus TaxID=651661 RepID=A0A1T5BJB6_9BACT|nr:immunity protein Tsi6 family protein [Dyadobacter psychrophilus]SKB47336.1 hypothetical protein SAMN05660293_00395 [Dyadobacter psychrophilus]
MDIKSANEIIQHAINLCISRRLVEPESTILISIEAQLDFLKAIISGKLSDNGGLNNIIVGQYALREFEPGDMEFANVLYEVEEIVDLVKRRRLIL